MRGNRGRFHFRFDLPFRFAGSRSGRARALCEDSPVTHAGLSHLHSGKVRDLYRMPAGRLLMVATDRISAFDFVLATPIPDKGRILTAMTVWWFERLGGLVPNHLIS